MKNPLWAVGKGWFPLVKEVEDALPPGWHLTIVKEKFGALRIHAERGVPSSTSDNTEWDSVWDIIATAESKSLLVCEECGKPGFLRQGSWMKTLCNTHAEGRPAHTYYVPEGHVCRNPWATCPECEKPFCHVCAVACYQCVKAWRHSACAFKHREETAHDGQVNDLAWLVDKATSSRRAADRIHGD